jgi:exoribonuclease-2
MSLRRGESGLTSGPHFALGVAAYAQATSPLRRFQDLANHRQLVAAAAGEAPPYDAEALQAIAAATSRAESDGRRAERSAVRYWLYRHLQETAAAGPIDAVVVEVGHRTVVVLEETALELPVQGLTGVAPGDRVRLRVAHVNPRADVVRLRAEPSGGVLP